jgi:hypothetical protein
MVLPVGAGAAPRGSVATDDGEGGAMTGHAGWRRNGAIGAGAAAGLLTMVMALGLIAGCGQAPSSTAATDAITPTSAAASTSQPPPESSTTTEPDVTSASTGSSTETTTQAEPAGAEEVFARLAASVRPLTVFAPAVLPEGATLSPRWLPVIDSADPQTYDGPPKSNPYVVGSGADSEIQVVFQTGQGWLVVIENFHGDLGDVTGTPVGSVAGKPADLYEVNGGELVQWSKDGLWYGIFGRGLERDAILATALGMKVLPGEVP